MIATPVAAIHSYDSRSLFAGALPRADALYGGLIMMLIVTSTRRVARAGIEE